MSEESHLTLVEQVAKLVPQEATVIFLGDGEFDGIGLQQQLQSYGWHYVCRTAQDIILTEEAEEFRPRDPGLRPGQFSAIPFALEQICPLYRVEGLLKSVSLCKDHLGCYFRTFRAISKPFCRHKIADSSLVR